MPIYTLEKLELHEATDLAKLIEANAEVGDALRKAEVLGEFSARMGGLTDDVAEVFARLSRNRHLTPDEIRGLLNAIPDGVSKETIKMLAGKPELLNALAKNPRAAKVLTLCKSPCIPEFATPSQVARIERLLTDAEKRGFQIDKTRVKEYFHRPTDQADLTQAISTILNNPCARRGPAAPRRAAMPSWMKLNCCNNLEFVNHQKFGLRLGRA